MEDLQKCNEENKEAVSGNCFKEENTLKLENLKLDGNCPEGKPYCLNNSNTTSHEDSFSRVLPLMSSYGKLNGYTGKDYSDSSTSGYDTSPPLSPSSVVNGGCPRRPKNELQLLDLPPELILHILTYLDARFTLLVLCQVCKRFCQLLSCEASWKTRFGKRWPHRDRKEDYGYVASWKKVCVEHEDMDEFWQDPDNNLDFYQLKQHFAPVDAAIVMAGGRLCVSGSRDRSIGIWDLSQLRRQEDAEKAFIHHLDGHKGWVWSLAGDPTGAARVCSGSWDNLVKLWDIQSNNVEMTSIREHRAAVLCMEWRHDVLITGCYDKHVRMFDLRECRVVAKLKYHSRPVLCLSTDDRFIISGSEDKSLCVYDRRACAVFKTLQLQSPVFSICRSSATGYNYLRLGGRSGHIYLIDTTNDSFQAIESSIDLGLGPKAKINGICHYGGAVVASSSDHSIKVLEPSRVATEICSLDKHNGDVATVHSSCGVLVSSSSDLSVGVWRPKSLRPGD